MVVQRQLLDDIYPASANRSVANDGVVLPRVLSHLGEGSCPVAQLWLLPPTAMHYVVTGTIMKLLPQHLREQLTRFGTSYWLALAWTLEKEIAMYLQSGASFSNVVAQDWTNGVREPLLLEGTCRNLEATPSPQRQPKEAARQGCCSTCCCGWKAGPSPKTLYAARDNPGN